MRMCFLFFFSARELFIFQHHNFLCAASLLCPRHSKNDGVHLENEFDFWNVHGIMNTWVACTLTLQETRSIHDSMNMES